MNTLLVDSIVQMVETLPLAERELVKQKLAMSHQQIVERRRDEIAQDAVESLAEFRSGKFQPQEATEAIADLRSFLQDDSVELML
jgi:hypothetical protein